MTIADCLDQRADAIDAAVIKREEVGDAARRAGIAANKVREFRSRFDQKFRENVQDGQPRGVAMSNAADDMFAAIQSEVALKKRRLALDIEAQNRIRQLADNHPGEEYIAMRSVMDFDPRRRVVTDNVAMREESIIGMAHSLIVDTLNQFRARAAGIVRPRAGMNDLVKELFGEASNNPAAREMAKGVSEAFEFLRQRFNKAGGNIGKLDRFGLPQIHNQSAVASVSKDEWIDFIMPLLDREQQINFETGLRMSDNELRDMLSSSYDRIVTEGMSDMDASTRLHKAGVANRRQQHRYLFFKNADAWTKYHDNFGGGDAFGALTNHIQGMARDISLMEVMGPNPESTLRLMQSLVEGREISEAIELTGRAARGVVGEQGAKANKLQDLYNVVSGKANVGGSSKVSMTFGGLRTFTNSIFLAGTFLVSLNDAMFSRITAKFNGLPANRVLARHLKLFAPGNAADRRAAIRSGFAAQGWANEAVAAMRILGELEGPEIIRRVSDTVLRASLLSPWTEAGRYGFQTEMLSFLTENSGRAFSDLPDELQTGLRSSGIGPDDWDIFRRTTPWTDDETGATFIRPMDAWVENQDVGNRIHQFILRESRFAVPTVTSTVRAGLTKGLPQNSFWGQAIRTVVHLKTFPVTIMHTHLNRGVMELRGANRAKYMAHLIIGTTVMGGVAEQLHQISQGKDPINMNPEDPIGRRFWLQAQMRGGGLGIFGDFLFADVNRFGGGLASTLLGPVLGTEFPQLVKLTAGNLQQAVVGEETNAANELSEFVQMNTPGFKLWYARLAFERLIADEIEKQLDPKAGVNFRRQERAVRSRTGQKYFAPPGKGIRRAPDLSEAFQE